MNSMDKRQCAPWTCCLVVIFFSLAVSEEHVCKSIEIKNQVYNFNLLENCTVIEGNLKIILIDYADSREYETLSFPKLVEITEFLLLYRVYGLKTLRHVFPNLAVIRGQALFFNYALVAFEMPDFEEIGLSSLTYIERGAIRLEKNPNLCYIDTVEWSYIGEQIEKDNNDNFMFGNKDVDECVNNCPKKDGNNLCTTIKTKDGYNQSLCWNSESCQDICPRKCGKIPCYGSRGSKRCCNISCVGGCSGPSSDQCTACKNFTHRGTCVKKCPSGTYEFKKRRCVRADECFSAKSPHNAYWKVHNGKCILECPTGYMQDKQDNHRCKKCDGPCPRVCLGLEVNHIGAAQSLRGCTVIKGVLAIAISGGNHIGKELEENLGSIEEVTQYIRIVKSHAILSLNFLKNLKVIHGKRLHNDRYSLFVLDNQNLQEIWDFKTHPRLTFANNKSSVFFHYNRKLCPNKIDELVDHLGIQAGMEDTDISRNNNGDQVACNLTKLDLHVLSLHHTFVIIQWTNFFFPDDKRKLLGYIINYREAPEQNITMFNTGDACGTDGWNQKDEKPDTDKNADKKAAILYDLKPFTQYAVYIQTYTIASANRGALSPIIFFTTKPDTPTHPRDVVVEAKVPGELYVKWKEPSKPNGNVTHYYVYWQPRFLKVERFDERDYCLDKLRLATTQKTTIEDTKLKNATFDGECCSCPISEEVQRQQKEERDYQIKFENFLHNSVYTKRRVRITPSPSSTSKRSIGTPPEVETFGNRTNSGPIPPPTMKPQDELIFGRERREIEPEKQTYRNIKENLNSLNGNFSMINSNGTMDVNRTDEDSEHVPYLAVVVYYRTEIVLQNLQHFQEYSIEVIACHDFDEGDDDKKLCSNRAITAARTLPSKEADDVDHRNITTRNATGEHDSHEVEFKWHDPPSPNGPIITYEIEYKKVDVANVKPIVICITHKEFRGIGGYRLLGLNSGNYSYKIRATSLAGKGSWTQTMYFFMTEDETDSTLPINIIAGIGSSVAILVVVLVGIVVWVVAKRHLMNEMPDGVLYASVNPEYLSAQDVYVPDGWEVAREKVKLLKKLGEGSFGWVYEGIAKGLFDDKKELKVAVKTVRDKSTIRDRIDFLNEASVMKSFKCHHVVKLLGVVSKGQPSYVIMELMENGDLKTYLRKHRPDEEENKGKKPPTLKRILQMAAEIADGMAYLNSKKYVHRDLAARNCMVDENLVVKIGDFGMTRDVYQTDYYRKGGKGLLPVRWMAPESLKDGLFTSRSDVWSYGIVLWEMATLAAQPYQGLSNEEVLNFVKEKGKMERPEGCPERLFILMQQCWMFHPKQRPSFIDIIESLLTEVDEHFTKNSYYNTAPSESNNIEELDPGDSSSLPLTGTSPDDDSQLIGDGDIPQSEVRDRYMKHEPTLPQKPPKHCRHEGKCECVDILPNDKQKLYKRTSAPNGNRSSSQQGKNVLWEDSSQSNGYGAIHSSDGSKESSKSSSSSNGPMNGLANGHVPRSHESKC